MVYIFIYTAQQAVQVGDIVYPVPLPAGAYYKTMAMQFKVGSKRFGQFAGPGPMRFVGGGAAGGFNYLWGK